MTGHASDHATRGVQLREVLESDLSIFFEQQLDPEANYKEAACQ